MFSTYSESQLIPIPDSSLTGVALHHLGQRFFQAGIENESSGQLFEKDHSEITERWLKGSDRPLLPERSGQITHPFESFESPRDRPSDLGYGNAARPYLQAHHRSDVLAEKAETDRLTGHPRQEAWLCGGQDSLLDRRDRPRNGDLTPAANLASVSRAAAARGRSITSIVSEVVQFGPKDSRAEIAALGGARVKMGSQTIFIGTQQVSSNNQNPIIASFDSKRAKNNWVRTNYEVTGTDGRGYGLFWSGKNLYGIFSVDGTQGNPDQDFRQAAADADQAWLRSYGQGGGAKISVIAKINPATGRMTDAAHLSSILSNGNSNSLAIANLKVNASGKLIVKADSWWAPRQPDGQAMTEVSVGSSPHNYTLVMAPNLQRVLRTSAIGWR